MRASVSRVKRPSLPYLVQLLQFQFPFALGWWREEVYLYYLELIFSQVLCETFNHFRIRIWKCSPPIFKPTRAGAGSTRLYKPYRFVPPKGYGFRVVLVVLAKNWRRTSVSLVSRRPISIGNLRWRRFRGDGDRTGRESLELRQPSIPVKNSLRSKRFLARFV